MSISPHHPLLDDRTIAFIEREVAIDVAACSADLRPSSARGFAARVSADRQRLTVHVRRAEATQLVQDLLSQDRIAVVFCLPATEAAIQIKGHRISLSAATAEACEHVETYRQGFVDSIVKLGYDRNFGLTYMAVDSGQMLAVSFTPEVVFEQTPGPLAGRRMRNPGSEVGS
jgi:hypothetical protein